jgi:uncharacterized repeat protein (TIGR03847 family)
MVQVRDMGDVIHIVAEAVGQPGRRTFRIHVLNGEGESASVWMEKEQLAALGEAVQNVLTDQGFSYAPLPADDQVEEPVFPLDSDVDFRAGQLSMGVDPEERRIVLTGAEAGAPEDSELAGVSFAFDYRRGHELSEQIRGVVSAGRRPCPLCSGPLDPEGHVCVRTNGHRASD